MYNLQKDKEEQDRLESERLQLDIERHSSKLKDAQREEALKFQREEEERLRLQELEDMNTATVTHSLTHLLTYSLTHSSTYLLTHLHPYLAQPNCPVNGVNPLVFPLRIKKK